MDENADGRIEYSEFINAMQRVQFDKEKRAKHGTTSMKATYEMGEMVEYNSRQHGWMKCKIIKIEVSGGVQLDCKPGFWIRGPDRMKVRKLNSLSKRVGKGEGGGFMGFLG